MPWPLAFPEPHDAKVASMQTEAPKSPDVLAKGTNRFVSSGPASKDALLPELFSSRAANQFSYLAAGTLLFASSILISRRAVVSRLRVNKPAGLFSSSRTLPQVNGAADAAAALTLATLNVGAFGAMVAGGTIWAFDLRTVDDLRRYVRRGGNDAPERPSFVESQEKEDDIEAWLTFFSNSIQGKAEPIDDIVKKEPKTQR